MGRPPLLFTGEVPGLEVLVWRHLDPSRWPLAWIVVEFRRSEPIDRDGRAMGKKVSLEIRLPEAHVRQTKETRWWAHRTEGITFGWMERVGREPRPRREKPLPQEALHLLRGAEQERLKSHPDRAPLAPPRVWIDPWRGGTPREVTLFSLLLILWQERMVEFGPEASPEVWAWVKTWLRTREDGRLWEILTTMRYYYVQAEDWRGLCQYVGHVIRFRLPRTGSQRLTGREEG
jgi:hypothetical protein